MDRGLERKEGVPVKAEARLSLTEQAYRQIEERIVTLRLEPGEVLSEASLSLELGIGRTPIREALQRLAREGLVNILPRRGILVSDINVRNQLELLAVRREVERLMARLCAVRASQEEKNAFHAPGSSHEWHDLPCLQKRLCAQCHGPDARTVAPILVSTLQAGVGPVAMRTPSCGGSQSHWQWRFQRCGSGIRHPDQLHREIHPGDPGSIEYQLILREQSTIPLRVDRPIEEA